MTVMESWVSGEVGTSETPFEAEARHWTSACTRSP